MREMLSSPVRQPVNPLVVAAATVVGILLASALALWAYYGSAVFFETVAAESGKLDVNPFNIFTALGPPIEWALTHLTRWFSEFGLIRGSAFGLAETNTEGWPASGASARTGETTPELGSERPAHRRVVHMIPRPVIVNLAVMQVVGENHPAGAARERVRRSLEFCCPLFIAAEPLLDEVQYRASGFPFLCLASPSSMT